MSARTPRLDDPVIAAGISMASMTDRICAITLRERPFVWWWIAFAPCLALTALLAVAIAYLFCRGIGIWGVNWPVMWGFAILSYVWWIAIASGGTIISALFFLTRSEWRDSINRIAESMMLFGALAAGIYPILHLGRPWLFYWLFFYPNSMTLWAQFRSPLLWDFWALLTYVLASVLFWYFGLLPDLASVRDRAVSRGKRRFYGVLACGFRGSRLQWTHMRAAYAVMAAIMAPVVVSIHSIVGLDFAGAATPGWHSTEFPPFFVCGALLSGFAITLLLVIPLRRMLHLQDMMTGRHLDVLCKLLLTSSLCIAYAYLMDAFTTFYGADPAEHELFRMRAFGEYMPVYWGALVFNCLLPQLFWIKRVRVHTPGIVAICLGVVIGMWLERYEIVVTSLARPHLSSAWGAFHGTFWDWATLFGTIGMFLGGILLAVRFVPVVSMHEMRELIASRTAAESGA
ncbi:MAG TPA: NrfD/PsrC family molybdoenzyme membrane anchor subunit [Steroidobacteraceae bacterium]|jgi:molybdopterin-containing oxidoreductase family membrane subunit|nr:NrfD/PsrC family molybdoenzyme membrane anchor subunit [Steroidobacteraceae bacterium]